MIEAEFNGQSDASRAIGSLRPTFTAKTILIRARRFEHLEAGLRLRYEFSRRFAPYVGISWEKAYGQTAEYRELEGGDAGRNAM